MPNGAFSDAIVLRSCMMLPHCRAERPCGLTPHCGGPVATNMVADNAIALASALLGQPVGGGMMQPGTMQAGGMQPGMMHASGMQPGMMQAGAMQAGGMPMDGVPLIGQQLAQAMGMVGVAPAVEAEKREEIVRPETRSQMPVPRFHPIPTQPVFQRSDGMPITSQTPPTQRTVAMSETRGLSESEIEAALDLAYLEGVAAAMDEVERQLEEKRQAVATARLQERILQQAESLQQQLAEQERMQLLAMQQMQQERLLQERQQQLEEQERMQLLAMQRMQQERLLQERQQQLDEQERMQLLAMQQMQRERQLQERQQQLAMSESIREPQRLSPPQGHVLTARANNNTNTIINTNALPNALPNVNAAQLAENLRTSLAGGMNNALDTLLNPTPRGQPAATASNQPLSAPQPRGQTQLASAAPELPGRPPVSPTRQWFGIQPNEESDSRILQAGFAADGEPIRP